MKATGNCFGLLARRLRGSLGAEPRALPPRDFPAATENVVRLFVSSTFRDLQAEREILRQEVFPILRRVCEERGFSFFEVDLRWGVTDDEARAGQVLAICLDEIDRCRPFLLGLIGARYGWVDPRAAQTLRENYRFRALAPYASSSVTELELRYGLLNSPEGAARPAARIYRRPSASAGEVATDPGAAAFEPLLRELAAGGFRTADTPEDLAGFGRVVCDDLLRLLEAQLPRRSGSGRERARAEMRQVAEALAHSFIAIPASEELIRLARRRPARIALVGPPGCGKTMVAAALVRTAMAGELEGSDIVAALGPMGWRDWSAAFRSLQAQLLPGPNASAAGGRDIHTAFQRALAAAATLNHTIALIDGIEDQNASGGTVPDWLPDQVAEATVVVSLRGEKDIASALRRKGWQVIHVPSSLGVHAPAFCERYFSPFGRRLQPTQVRRLTRPVDAAHRLQL